MEKGYAVTVAFTLLENSDEQFTGYWKYGKEQVGDTDHWYDLGTLIANATVTGRKGTGYSISADAKTLTVTLIDGLRGDDDLSKNGNIDDPGVPVLKVATDVKEIPLLTPWGLFIISAFAGLIAIRKLKP